jgi:hypothetical protein
VSTWRDQSGAPIQEYVSLTGADRVYLEMLEMWLGMYPEIRNIG